VAYLKTFPQYFPGVITDGHRIGNQTEVPEFDAGGTHFVLTM
jgi:hypothetical protein